MRQMDDLTNNSSIWYEYEEQKPVIIEGYQKRDTIKVSCSYIYKVEKKQSVKSVIFRTTCNIYAQKPKLLYQPIFLDQLTSFKLNSKTFIKL